MSQNIEYDLNDMELFDKGSTQPKKRELRVDIDRIDMEYGQDIETLITTLQEAKDKCQRDGLFDDRVYLHVYDRGENMQERREITIEAKRIETDEEYRKRLKRIEKAKLVKREYDTKKFYELKKELGL